jgi:hypothetical protein
MSFVSRTVEDPISDEEAEQLRQQVPHPPTKLPPGMFACAICGVAAGDPGWPDAPPKSLFTAKERHQLGLAEPSLALATPRCDDCALLRKQATSLFEAHPRLDATDPQALDKIENTLIALHLLDKPLTRSVTTDELVRLVRHLSGPGNHARWYSENGTCNQRRFGHLMPGARQALRKGFAAMLAERMASGSPPVNVPPPFPRGPGTAILKGCIMCGVSAVRLAAVQVVKLGGVAQASREVWRELSCQPASLGGPLSSAMLQGYTCPSCTRAIEQSNRAIGPTAMERGLLNHLFEAKRTTLADQLRAMFADANYAPMVQGYGALVFIASKRGNPAPPPSEQPWQHLTAWLRALLPNGAEGPLSQSG